MDKTINILENGKIKRSVNMDLLKKEESHSLNVVSVDSKNEREELRVTGAKLLDVLGLKNFNRTKYIRFLSRDGYSIGIDREILLTRDLYLIYLVEKEDIRHLDQVKLVIPGERSIYWVSNLMEIDLSYENMYINTREIISFSQLEKEGFLVDYPFQDFRGKALSGDLLLKSYESQLDGIYIKSFDGLKKDEYRDIFKEAFIRKEGDSYTLVTSSQARGMKVKDIAYFKYDRFAFVNLYKFFMTYEKYAFYELLEDLEMIGDSYTINYKDTSIELSLDDFKTLRLIDGEDLKVEILGRQLDVQDISGFSLK